MRIFFDTNVLVSAMAFHGGLCSTLLAEAFEKHEVEVTEYILEELRDVLIRKIYRSDSEVHDWIMGLREYARILPIVTPIQIDLRDPNDLPIISAAVRAQSDILVSGDKDLLELINPPIRILSPRALHDVIVRV